MALVEIKEPLKASSISLQAYRTSGALRADQQKSKYDITVGGKKIIMEGGHEGLMTWW